VAAKVIKLFDFAAALKWFFSESLSIMMVDYFLYCHGHKKNGNLAKKIGA